MAVAPEIFPLDPNYNTFLKCQEEFKICTISHQKIELDDLKCYICLIKYPTTEDLNTHVHKLPEIYYCTYCARYVNTTHGCLKSKMLCAFCRQPLKGRSVKNHACFHLYTREDLDKLKSSGSYRCGLCDSNVANNDTIPHRFECQIKAFDRRVAKCKKCGISFTNKREYRKHYSNSHRTIKRRIYNCKGCKITFDTRTKYRRHRYEVHDDKCCQICFMCGKTVMNLNQHIKSVHGNPNEVKCSECDKTFSCKKHLSRHKLVHSSDFKHKCSTCGKGFKTPYSLRVHKRSHDAVKPFECSVCLKTFTTKQWRDNHLKTH